MPNLNHFIYKPQAAIVGTKMNYLGLKKTEDRAALIAYLRTLSDSPAPLPSNEDIQAEQTAFAATQPKAAAPAADAKAPEAKGKEAGAKDAPPAAATKTGATPDAIANKRIGRSIVITGPAGKRCAARCEHQTR